MAILGTDNLEIAHPLGAAVLQNAMAEWLRNDQIEVITVHSTLPDPADFEKRKIRSALKDRAPMADETPAKQYLPVKKTSTEKQQPTFQLTTQTKG